MCDFFCKYIALIDKIDTAVPEIEIYLLLLLQWEQKKLFKEYGVVNFKQNILPSIKKVSSYLRLRARNPRIRINIEIIQTLNPRRENKQSSSLEHILHQLIVQTFNFFLIFLDFLFLFIYKLSSPYLILFTFSQFCRHPIIKSLILILK